MFENDHIVKYKDITIRKFIEDLAIQELIDEKDIVDKDPSDLIYKNIFPYKNIPGTQEVVKAFILIGVDMPRVSTKNYFFKDMLINIIVLCHKEKMKTDYTGTRVDLLATAVKRVISRSKEYSGYELELVSDFEEVDERGMYFARNMRFATPETNSAGRCR